MQAKSLGVLTASALLAAAAAFPSSAQNATPGQEPSLEEGAPAASERTLRREGARAVPGITAERGASRSVGRSAPGVDPAAARRAFTLIGRTKDGEDVRIEPNDDLIRAMERRARGDGPRGSLDQPGAPAAGQEGRSRGPDNRARVADARAYPFSAVGYLDMENSEGGIWNCTAALIGPSTALTAAHCLYDHADENGWLQDFLFTPGLNGEEKGPFGTYGHEATYVFEGFISEHDGTYDSVWYYDIGIVQFAEPVGNVTGWLGYYEEAEAFQGNLVGYHEDLEAFTMWRSACDVSADGIGDYDFLHDCYFSEGVTGAPVYVSHQTGPYIVGVNVGTIGDDNWALRVDQEVTEWIRSALSQ